MATIGLDSLYYAKITEDAFGNETYGTPKVLAKAMKADLSIEYSEGSLFADDAMTENIKEFKSGKLSLGVKDLGNEVAADLTGARVDSNGVLIDRGEDSAEPVAVGFRAKKPNGKYRYFWLYRVKFAVPPTSLATKGDSIAFTTPTIEGTIMTRNRAMVDGTHPWKAEVTELDSGATSVITNWFNTVYETGTVQNALLGEIDFGIGTQMTPDFNPNVFSYTVETGNASVAPTITALSDTANVFTKFNGESIVPGSEQDLSTGYGNVYEIGVEDGSLRAHYVVIVHRV